MFEVLARAVEEVEVPVDSAALAQLWGLIDRLTAKATMASAAFDAAGLWDLDGATSLMGWLRHHAGMTNRNAAGTAQTAKRLQRAPVTAAAWVDGDLTGGQVGAIVANVSDRTADLWSAHESTVVPTVAPLPVPDVAAAMRVWATRADATLDANDESAPMRSLHCSTTLDGRGELTGSFDAESAHVVTTALRVGQTTDAGTDPVRSPAERRADALVDICRFFLDHQHINPAGRHRPHVNLIVDLDQRDAGDPAAGSTIDGITLTPETISRLLCDCGTHRVLTRGRSTIVDYGTTTRTIPAPLFNTLVIRDRHCRWPGCDQRATWCDGHHLQHWEHGGATRQDNIVLLCRRHHTTAHRPGWHAKLLPDATLEITKPDGHVHTTRPPPRC